MNTTSIEWCDVTWNPVSGCLHNCSYCYAKGIATRFNGGDFTPKFHPDRLSQPMRVRKPKKIFVGSMTDLGGSWVQPTWMNSILQTVDACPHHVFMFLTKRPDNIRKWFVELRKNAWIGCTVEDQEHINRIDEIRSLDTVPVRFVSFEPLLSPIKADLTGIDWIILGARTAPLTLPAKVWVDDLITQARKASCAVLLKDSLEGLGVPLYREWPEVRV
jgi:protein gp37